MSDGPESFDGVITVEWRATPPGRVMPGWTFTVRAEDGTLIPTVTEMTLHARADAGVWAELDMFTDPEGRPSISEMHVGDDGHLRHGVFRYQVAGMSVTQ